MPFMLYDVAVVQGQEHYTFVREVMLAGNRGPLASYSRGLNHQQLVPFEWRASSGDLLQLLGGSPATHAIVIDLKPRVSGNVSLYRLLNVCGYSYEEWTPLGLQLQVLYSDRSEPNPHLFKNSFVGPTNPGAVVREFLYVNGGVSKGKWTWGMVGRVNGALLWPDAFKFLVNCLQ